jgi:hypothetical protein
MTTIPKREPKRWYNGSTQSSRRTPLGGCTIGDALVSGQPFDEAVVVFRDLAEVGPADRRHLPTLVEEADDHGRLLHG